MFTIDASTKSRKATAASRASVSLPRRVARKEGDAVGVAVAIGGPLAVGYRLRRPIVCSTNYFPVALSVASFTPMGDTSPKDGGLVADGATAEFAGQLFFRLWRVSHARTAAALEPLGLTTALFSLVNVLGA